jgi:predicted RNase H-like HicB family nuclease
MNDMHSLIFTEQLFREDGVIIAYCPELDVSSCGHTEEEARENLQTALRLFLEEAARMGTLADILSEAGYDVSQPLMLSPMFSVSIRQLSLEEPLSACLA